MVTINVSVIKRQISKISLELLSLEEKLQLNIN